MTDEGLFSMAEIMQFTMWPAKPKQLLSGDFRGLAVLEPYSEFPVILTTVKTEEVVSVCMIGRFNHKRSVNIFWFYQTTTLGISFGKLPFPAFFLTLLHVCGESWSS